MLCEIEKKGFSFFFGYSTFYHSTLESKNFRAGIGTAFNVNENCGIMYETNQTFNRPIDELEPKNLDKKSNIKDCLNNAKT